MAGESQTGPEKKVRNARPAGLLTRDTTWRDETELRRNNRRRRYLEKHPEYLSDPGLELADPLTFDRLVRRHFSAVERRNERREKGFSGSLEADMLRSEARLEELAKQPTAPTNNRIGMTSQTLQAESNVKTAETRGDREEDLAEWHDVMTRRFLRGEDRDFDYSQTDKNEDLDDLQTEQREAQDQWFDDEEPECAIPDKADRTVAGGDTGLQDF